MRAKMIAMIGLTALLGPTGVVRAQEQQPSSSVQPSAGSYIVLGQITSASSGCSTFGQTKGLMTEAILYYPGPGATGAYLRQPVSDALSTIFPEYDVRVIDLPKTPAAGVDTWSGKFFEHFEPGGPSYNGTFTGKISFIDSYSFLFTVTVSVPFLRCTDTQNLATVSTSH
jgi:hypothetical protein